MPPLSVRNGHQICASRTSHISATVMAGQWRCRFVCIGSDDTVIEPGTTGALVNAAGRFVCAGNAEFQRIPIAITANSGMSNLMFFIISVWFLAELVLQTQHGNQFVGVLDGGGLQLDKLSNGLVVVDAVIR